MAEVLGAVASTITLAALFKTCLDAFEFIQTSRRQDVDFKKLKLRLNIEKCRLYVWGDTMGLTSPTEAGKERLVDKLHFPDIVQQILEQIFELFSDSHRIEDKYGCGQMAQDAEPESQKSDRHLKNLASSFSNFSITPSKRMQDAKAVKNIIWCIQDRKKFGLLVTEIKELIDSLQSVSVIGKAEVMRQNIANIQDPETLTQIAQVCVEDYPDIADTASMKADTISMLSTDRHHVASWAEQICVAPTEPDEEDMLDLESLTVTELKHKILELRRQVQERTLEEKLETGRGEDSKNQAVAEVRAEGLDETRLKEKEGMAEAWKVNNGPKDKLETERGADDTRGAGDQSALGAADEWDRIEKWIDKAIHNLDEVEAQRPVTQDEKFRIARHFASFKRDQDYLQNLRRSQLSKARPPTNKTQ